MKVLFILLCLSLLACNESSPEFVNEAVKPITGVVVSEKPATAPVVEDVPDNTYSLIQSANIPEDVIPYISLFIYYGNIFGKNLNVSSLIVIFETTTAGWAGQCSSINSNKNKLIKLNKSMWQGLSSIYREQLVLHEAAHCLLGRSHKGNDFYNPQSIMNPTLFPDYIYVQRYNEFIYELFEVVDSDHEFSFGELVPRVVFQN